MSICFRCSFTSAMESSLSPVSYFFLHAPATTAIYTLSLHDALPISRQSPAGARPLGVGPGASTIPGPTPSGRDRKSTRLNSSHVEISYAVFCLKKKNQRTMQIKHQEIRSNE